MLACRLGAKPVPARERTNVASAGVSTRQIVILNLMPVASPRRVAPVLNQPPLGRAIPRRDTTRSRAVAALKPWADPACRALLDALAPVDPIVEWVLDTVPDPARVVLHALPTDAVGHIPTEVEAVLILLGLHRDPRHLPALRFRFRGDTDGLVRWFLTGLTPALLGDLEPLGGLDFADRWVTAGRALSELASMTGAGLTPAEIRMHLHCGTRPDATQLALLRHLHRH